MSELLPDGISELADCPHPFFAAIKRALLFLSFEELPKDEQPPRRIWLDDERLVAHFERVQRDRDAKWNTDGPRAIDDPVQNDAARSLISE